jgi:hypothetical protein
MHGWGTADTRGFAVGAEAPPIPREGFKEMVFTVRAIDGRC